MEVCSGYIAAGAKSESLVVPVEAAGSHAHTLTHGEPEVYFQDSLVRAAIQLHSFASHLCL